MPKYVTGGFDTTKTKQSIGDISMFLLWIVGKFWTGFESYIKKLSNFIHLPYIPICRARLTNFNEQTAVILSVLIISLFSSFIGSVVVLHWFHEYARFPKFDSASYSGNLPAQFKQANLPNISDVERNHHSNLQVGTSILSDQLSD